MLAPERVWGFESPSSHKTETTGQKCLPASKGRTLAVERLADGAVALLAAAAAGESVDADALANFARGAIETTELGRLALAVIDGGEHAPRRAIELCRLILAQARTARAALTEGG